MILNDGIQREKYKKVYLNKKTFLDIILMDYYYDILKGCFAKIDNRATITSSYCEKAKNIKLSALIKIIQENDNKIFNFNLEVYFNEYSFRIEMDRMEIIQHQYLSFPDFINSRFQMYDYIAELLYLIFRQTLSKGTSFKNYISCLINSIKNFKMEMKNNKDINTKKVYAILDYVCQYRPKVVNLDNSDKYYRIRNCDFSEIREKKDGLNPNQEYVKKMGRLNRKHECILYLTYNNPTICVFETKVNSKENFCISNIHIKTPVEVVDFSNFDRLIIDFSFELEYDPFLNRLKTLFIMECLVETEGELTYSICNDIKDYIKQRNPKIKGYIYSSVWDITGYNVALYYNPNIDKYADVKYVFYSQYILKDGIVIRKDIKKRDFYRKKNWQKVTDSKKFVISIFQNQRIDKNKILEMFEEKDFIFE